MNANIQAYISQKNEAFKSLQKAEIGSPEADKLFEEVSRLKGLIKKEEAEEAKHDAMLAAIEARNEKLKILTDYDEMTIACAIVAADKKASIDEKNEAYTALKSVREKIENMIAGSVAKPKSAATAPTGTRTAGTSDAILASYHNHVASGLSSTEAKKACVAEGFAKGTVGSAVLAWERENGLK